MFEGYIQQDICIERTSNKLRCTWSRAFLCYASNIYVYHSRLGIKIFALYEMYYVLIDENI